MNATEYAEFVGIVTNMVQLNDLRALLAPPLLPAERVAAWSAAGFSPVECGQLLVAVAS